MSKPLYSLVKDHLPKSKAYVSDDEILVLNRHDFILNEVSPVNSILKLAGIKIGYAYTLYLGHLDMFAYGLKTDQKIKILITDPSLWIAGFYIWIRAGANKENITVYAPRGLSVYEPKSAFIKEMWDGFVGCLDTSPQVENVGNKKDFWFILGHTTAAEKTMYAADKFSAVAQGVLALKDYARVNHFHERAYLEGKRIFMSVSLEGNAFAVKL